MRRLGTLEESIVSAKHGFAELVRTALRVRGMTHLQLAQRIGVSEARISQLLTSTANPTLKTMSRIADALGCMFTIRLELIDK